MRIAKKSEYFNRPLYVCERRKSSDELGQMIQLYEENISSLCTHQCLTISEMFEFKLNN